MSIDLQAELAKAPVVVEPGTYTWVVESRRSVQDGQRHFLILRLLQDDRRVQIVLGAHNPLTFEFIRALDEDWSGIDDLSELLDLCVGMKRRSKIDRTNDDKYNIVIHSTIEKIPAFAPPFPAPAALPAPAAYFVQMQTQTQTQTNDIPLYRTNLVRYVPRPTDGTNATTLLERYAAEQAPELEPAIYAVSTKSGTRLVQLEADGTAKYV